eukprot:6511335-Alexandrium_andersonii.AAC.1
MRCEVDVLRHFLRTVASGARPLPAMFGEAYNATKHYFDANALPPDVKLPPRAKAAVGVEYSIFVADETVVLRHSTGDTWKTHEVDGGLEYEFRTNAFCRYSEVAARTLALIQTSGA